MTKSSQQNSKNKLSFETISQSFGSSFTIRKFNDQTKNTEPVWHFHPELELVYVKGGNGKRHIGNHLSYFHDGDLLLLGSHLPHLGFTDRLTGNQTETVVQFKSDFLGAEFFNSPEMGGIRDLLEKSKYGIVFDEPAKSKLGFQIEALAELPSFPRLMSFIRILKELSESKEYQLLHEEAYKVSVKVAENEKIRTVFKYVRQRFQSTISLDEISSVSNMTNPAFCRYFKKQTGKTFTYFLNEFRIVHACKLLSETSMQITQIAEESGYSNFSYFNKQFQKITGKTPSSYRLEFRHLVNEA